MKRLPDSCRPVKAKSLVPFVNGANALMALLLVGISSVLFFSSLACSPPLEPETALAREDSLALLTVFRANHKPWNRTLWIGRDGSGHITNLNLARQSFDTIPPEIRKLIYLQILDLSGNQLRKVPKEMEELTALTVLRLDFNQLTELPDGLRLPNLMELGLISNRLKSLPTNVDVTGLKFLSIDSNGISSLPPDFQYLSNLVFLSIGANALDSLPSFFNQESFPHLRRLVLSQNHLAALPSAMTGFQLDYLDLGKNRLCPPDTAIGDSSWISLSAWLDAFDRDWKETQDCKKQ